MVRKLDIKDIGGKNAQNGFPYVTIFWEFEVFHLLTFLNFKHAHLSCASCIILFFIFLVSGNVDWQDV